VAIVGILAAIAIPQYQEYTIRSRVSEGLNLASMAKTAVAETYQTNTAWPTDNAAAGLSTTISSKYVTSVSVGAGGAGQILVTFSDSVGITNPGTIIFSPTAATSAVDWNCQGGTLASRYRPANCR
jgi:type IV pilus assembly protein PilA